MCQLRNQQCGGKVIVGRMFIHVVSRDTERLLKAMNFWEFALAP